MGTDEAGKPYVATPSAKSQAILNAALEAGVLEIHSLTIVIVVGADGVLDMAASAPSAEAAEALTPLTLMQALRRMPPTGAVVDTIQRTEIVKS